MQMTMTMTIVIERENQLKIMDLLSSSLFNIRNFRESKFYACLFNIRKE